MGLEDARRQKSGQLGLPLDAKDEALEYQRSGEASTATNGRERSGIGDLMEEIVDRGNVVKALKRVKRNKGSPGIDGMKVEELSGHLAEHWESIREQLRAGDYQPKPVKRQTIPKADGGSRELGIPRVLDRLIQPGLIPAAPIPI